MNLFGRDGQGDVSNQSIKEISYKLGLSTPVYISYFFKHQTGIFKIIFLAQFMYIEKTLKYG